MIFMGYSYFHGNGGPTVGSGLIQLVSGGSGDWWDGFIVLYYLNM